MIIVVDEKEVIFIDNTYPMEARYPLFVMENTAGEMVYKRAKQYFYPKFNFVDAHRFYSSCKTTSWFRLPKGEYRLYPRQIHRV